MIVELGKEHYGQIIQVWENAVRATHDFLKEEDIQFYKQKIFDEYLDAVDLYGYRDRKETLLGFLGLSQESIQMLFIRSTTRGLGIGKKLLQFAIDEKGMKYVDVNEQNEQAVGFYKHMGFVVKDRSTTDDLGKPYPILSMQLK